MGGGCCIGDCFDLRSVPIIGDIIDIFCSDCCVGVSSGPSESERHAQEVANELAEMKEKVAEATEKQESDIMDYINSSMNSFMTEIDKLNKQSFGGVTLNINTKTIKEKHTSLKNSVVGCVSGVMNKRLVQTDKELSTILEERDKNKRKANFDGFISRVKKQAISEFKKKVEKTVKEQSKVVSDEIETRKKEVDARMKESIKELTEIMEVKEKSNAALEKKQIDYMYQSSLCDLLLAEIEG